MERNKYIQASYIFWIAMHDRLLTQDRLQQMRIGKDASCALCGDQPETNEHLFFKCNSQNIHGESSQMTEDTDKKSGNKDDLKVFCKGSKRDNKQRAVMGNIDCTNI